MSSPLLSQAEVKGRFDYDPETGIFTDKTTGLHAGKPDAHGYLRVSIGGKSVPLHRLAFMWMLGHWPSALVDHVNGKITDNRWGNLRPATATQNAQNKKVSGAVAAKGGQKGVSIGADGRYRASIMVDGIRYKIPGSFDSASGAHKAYQDACNRMFGQFERVVGAATVDAPCRNDSTAKQAQLDILKRRREVVEKQLADIDAAIDALEKNARRMRGPKDQHVYDAMRHKEKQAEKMSRMTQRLVLMNKLHPIANGS